MENDIGKRKALIQGNCKKTCYISLSTRSNSAALVTLLISASLCSGKFFAKFFYRNFQSAEICNNKMSAVLILQGTIPARIIGFLAARI